MSNTERKLLKLPIGIQTFEEIIREGYIYVDKTKYLIDLTNNGKVYFLSRPRRFGKSLTVSTFDALFSGRKELFKGLYAEEFFERPEYKTYPVVRFDMSKVTTDDGLDNMRKSMLRQVIRNADKYGVTVNYDSPADALGELIATLGDRGEPVAVLVDEYDKPILDCLDKKERAEEVREVLRGFYTQIKAEDASIKFVFITGITKFTRTGVFSVMNNLKDISTKDEYAAMLGYTDEEMLLNFGPHIERTAEKLGVTRENLLNRIREYYDGFSFNGVQRVYNPFSTLNFFDDSKFNNYWFESGQPSFISKYIRAHSLSVPEFRGKEVDSSFASVHEIENAEPESFLYQAGYLTFREILTDEDLRISYILDYPNEEVIESVSRLFIQDVAGLGNNYLGFNRELTAAFDSDDIQKVIEVIDRILASIPYNLFADNERYYHSLIYCIIVSAGIAARAEDRSKAGSADIVVQRKGRYYVIEIKTSPNEASSLKAAEAAVEQIKKRAYHKKFPTDSTKLLGIAIDLEGRKVGHYILQSSMDV